jgi:NitT/TauT family transport system ATP-binding protein
MLEFQEVSVTYAGSPPANRVEAVRSVTLTMRHGELLTLIGPSGCGKSTLLNVAGGLRKPTSGRVVVNGRDMRGPQPDTLAMVFQDYSLFPWRTALANVEAGLEFRGVDQRQRRESARTYLKMVGLESFESSYPRQLSGGMRQRVAIARALTLETPVLLMDEPFGALDEQTRTILGEEISQIFAATNKTTLLVTHSLAEAVFLSDRIAVMSRRPGQVQEVIDVPAPQPRTPDFMTSPVFHQIRDHLFQILHDEMRAATLGGPGPDEA